MTLTPKQARFVQEYLIDFNATQAAIRAGYSEKTAQSISTENLSKPLVQKAIEEGKQQLSQNNSLTQQFIIERLKAIAEQKVEKATGGDVIKALELLGKYLDMWKENSTVNLVMPNVTVKGRSPKS